MSAEFPHPVPEAIRATAGGKYGLKHLQIRNPLTDERCLATTIAGYTGPEIEIQAPTGDLSYWNENGKICGNDPQGTAPLPAEERDLFTDVIWTQS